VGARAAGESGSVNTTLPRSLEIGGITHIECFRGQNYVILQNYSATTPPSDQPIIAPGGVIQGTNEFHVYAVTHTPGEQLGQLLFTGTSVIACQDYASRSGLT
jgi:hypothetical protein